MQKKRVFLIDDHPLVCNGLRLLISQQNDLEVCGDAGSAAEAMEKLGPSQPDLVILDLSLQDCPGLDLIKRIRSTQHGLPVLVLSMHNEDLYAERSLRAGAKGYVMKQESPKVVLEAIREVLGGEIYLSSAMSSKMLRKLLAEGPEPEMHPMEKLTDRELEIFQLIGKGKPTREIAKDLSVSIKTVEAHREHIKKKLGIKSAGQLAHRAFQWVQEEMPMQG